MGSRKVSTSCSTSDTRRKLSITFSLHRLLHVQNANCKYTEASNTSLIAAQTLQTVSSQKVKVNAAAYYTECCALLFAYSEYNEVGYSERQKISRRYEKSEISMKGR